MNIPNKQEKLSVEQADPIIDYNQQRYTQEALIESVTQ